MAVPVIEKDCTVRTANTTYSVQANPPLVIAVDRNTGEEVHTAGDAAHSLYDEIKDLTEESEEAVESGLERAGNLIRRMVGAKPDDDEDAPPDAA